MKIPLEGVDLAGGNKFDFKKNEYSNRIFLFNLQDSQSEDAGQREFVRCRYLKLPYHTNR